jgi:hypothetical protein
MRETKTANRPAPWPQRFLAETLAPARPAAAWHSEARPRGRAGSRAAAIGAGGGGAAGQQEGAAEVRRPAAGRGRAALQGLGRGGAMGRSRTRDAPLGQVKGSRCILGHWWAICSFLSLGHTINIFWAKSRVVLGLPARLDK